MAVREVTPEDLLKFLADRGSLDSYDYARETGSEHQAVVGAIKSLESLGDVSSWCNHVQALLSPISYISADRDCGAEPNGAMAANRRGERDCA